MASERLQWGAATGVGGAMAQRNAVPPTTEPPAGTRRRIRQPIQITDLRDDQSYLEGDPLPVAAIEIAGIRPCSSCRCSRTSELVGAITIYRKEVRPFTDKQIELVTNLPPRPSSPSRTRGCSSELREISLEQQTATTDVLKVISAHPGNCSRCSRPCWKTPRASVRRSSAIFISSKVTRFALPQCIASATYAEDAKARPAGPSRREACFVASLSPRR